MPTQICCFALYSLDKISKFTYYVMSERMLPNTLFPLESRDESGFPIIPNMSGGALRNYLKRKTKCILITKHILKKFNSNFVLDNIRESSKGS